MSIASGETYDTQRQHRFIGFGGFKPWWPSLIWNVMKMPENHGKPSRFKGKRTKSVRCVRCVCCLHWNPGESTLIPVPCAVPHWEIFPKGWNHGPNAWKQDSSHWITRDLTYFQVTLLWSFTRNLFYWQVAGVFTLSTFVPFKLFQTPSCGVLSSRTRLL